MSWFKERNNGPVNILYGKNHEKCKQTTKSFGKEL